MKHITENEQVNFAMQMQWEELVKEHPYVDLLTDVGFKHVFGNPANKTLLIDFLNAVISDRHIVDLTYGNNDRIPTMKDSKHSRLNLLCITDDGSRIIVELQRSPQKDYIYRSIYYSSLLIREQVEADSNTFYFSPVYCINILDFILPEFSHLTDVKTSLTMRERTKGVELHRLLTIIYIELPKFKKTLGELDRGNLLDFFCYCLRNIYKLKNIPEPLQKIRYLFDAAEAAAMDSQEKISYIHEMNTARDIRNQIQFAEDKGREDGLEKGRAKGRSEERKTMASKLKADGFDIDLISKYTGLTREEIEEL
ncbi:MAG: Rpn family recombination-promoting nuclease/putative transposase [Bacteroidales bacterium]|nr:Rpn family recombination-promoting nuclease/putative transposase [Bacteroidales bacterium]